MEKDIVNRVENSGIVQINLDDFYSKGDRMVFDIKDFLHERVVLFEKPFREFVKNNNWKIFQNKSVAITCSSDAIVPLWTYILISTYLKPLAKRVVLGNEADLEKSIFQDVFNQHDFSIYQDKNVIVKGCGKFPIPESVYVDFTYRLQEYAKTIMFGEACSAVPLYKR